MNDGDVDDAKGCVAAVSMLTALASVGGLCYGLTQTVSEWFLWTAPIWGTPFVCGWCSFWWWLLVSKTK